MMKAVNRMGFVGSNLYYAGFCSSDLEMRGIAVPKRSFVFCLSTGKWTGRGRREMKGGERSTMKVSN